MTHPRFAQRRNFIADLETAVPDFYEHVGQHLKSWVPSAPRLKENKSEAESVSTKALGEAAEDTAMES